MNASATLSGKKVAILAASGVEQVELVEPRQAVEAADATTVLISVEAGAKDGRVQAMNADINPADTFPVDALVDEVSVDDFDALILPGGAVNPDKLRQDGTAVAFVRDFVESGKPLGAICHAPWTLIEADVVHDKRVTSYPSLRTDLANAGATVVDEEVVTDNGLVTSRGPDDLPAFCSKIVEEFLKAATTADGPPQTTARAQLEQGLLPLRIELRESRSSARLTLISAAMVRSWRNDLRDAEFW